MKRTTILMLALGLVLSTLIVPAPTPAAAQGGGDRVLFVSSQGDNKTDIYVMNPDGSGLTNLTNQPFRDMEPEWSPDGSRIVFTSERDSKVRYRTNIYVMNADGSNVVRLTTNFYTRSPTWSPDGSQIAYVDDGIVVMNSDGSNKQRLTLDAPGLDAADPREAHSPTWSPSGDRIAFTDRDSAKYRNIYTIDLATNNIVKIVGGEKVYQETGGRWLPRTLAWSPDGSQIAIAATLPHLRTRIHLFLIEADGTGLRNISTVTPVPGVGTITHTSPEWLPNGSQLVFGCINRDSVSHICTMNADGTNIRYITEGLGFIDAGSPSWWGPEQANPPAPTPDPEPPSADARCFEETGFCIDGRIREYWEQNGGLPVFGLPIGPQQPELIEGQQIQAQWFERNRLELHPENTPPYDVLLGRLGADRLAQQGYDWQSIPQEAPQEGCRYFEETGRNVCGDILAAWRANGLELDGQGGFNESENLALFGLPLTGVGTEVSSDGSELQVQYFERARFELHPENEPPFNVLLGLLGSEVRGAR